MTDFATRPTVSRSGRRIGLLVDNPRRDLAGVTLLATELARRGHSAFLVPMNLKDMELAALGTDTVVLNYLRKANQGLAAELMDAGMQAVVSDTEGGIGIIDDWGEVSNHYDQIVADRHYVRSGIARMCLWGSRLSEHVVSTRLFRRDQVAITGSPRFDFYTDPWRDAARQLVGPEEAAIAARAGDDDMVLVIGSFNFANPQFRTMREEIEGRILTTGYSRAVVERQASQDKEAMDQTIALVNRLVVDHPQTRFVYRPHPFENLSTYEGRFVDAPNLDIVCEGTVDGWLLRSKAVVSTVDCSLAVEAAMAGVPSLIPGWITPDMAVASVVDAGFVLPDIDALSDYLRDCLSSGWNGFSAEKGAQVDGVISDWFCAADGQSHRRVADELDEVGHWFGKLDRTQLKRIHYGFTDEDVPVRTLAHRTVRSRFDIPRRYRVRDRKVPPFRWDSSPKRFTEPEVRRISDAIVAADTERNPNAIRLRAAASGDYDFGYVGRSLVFEPAG